MRERKLVTWLMVLIFTMSFLLVPTSTKVLASESKSVFKTFTVNGVKPSSTTVNGKGTSGASVKAYVNGKQLGKTVTVNSKGEYSITIPKQKVNTKIVVKMSKSGYKTSEKSVTVLNTFSNFTVNSVKNTSTTISGKGTSRATVKAYVNGKQIGKTATVDSNGNYKISSVPKQKAGTKVAVKISKSGYRTSEKSVTVMDKIPPSLTVNAVYDSSTAVTGKTEIGATVVVKIGSKSYNAKVDSKGGFRVTIPKQKVDTAIKVTSSDKAKNTSTSTVKVKYKKEFRNEAFEESSQIILVTTEGMNSSYGTMKLYDKKDGSWQVLRETPARLGAKGIEYISKRKQSTSKTPAGVMNIISSFGMLDNPGSKYPYFKIKDSHYWDLNSGSPTYNRLVNSNPGDDYEHLKSYATQYKYTLVTDYNYDQVANKGGAIFVHVNGRGATGGCVSVSEAEMLKLMKWVDPKKNPKLVVIPTTDLSKYYY